MQRSWFGKDLLQLYNPSHRGHKTIHFLQVSWLKASRPVRLPASAVAYGQPSLFTVSGNARALTLFPIKRFRAPKMAFPLYDLSSLLSSDLGEIPFEGCFQG